MPHIRPRLRADKKNADGKCPIMVVYQNGRNEFKIPTARPVEVAHWNSATKNQEWVRAAESGSAELNMIIRTRIAELTQLQDAFYLQHSQRYPTAEEMKDIYNLKNGKAKIKDISMFGLFDDFIHYKSAERGVNNVTYGVYKNYKKVKERLRLYQEHTGQLLTFESIDNTFADKFIRYMTDEHDSGANTIGSYITILKTFFKYCINNRGVNISLSALSSMKSRHEENWFTYLTMAELQELFKKDFHMAPLYDKTRDAFCLQCCLGCRYSDLIVIVGANIIKEEGKWFLKMKTKKNEKRILVPLAPQATAILEKYQGYSPVEWIPKINICCRYIKDVCREAGIDSPEEVTRGGGDKRESKIFKKYQLITTHTARRTFINLMRKERIDDATIAAMSGQSIKTLQRYKHIDTTDVEEAIQKVFAEKPSKLKIA